MRFTPDGRTLVTSGADGVLIVWDVARGEIRETLSGHAKGEVYGLDVSPDGRTLYSGGHDERAFAWDLTGDRSLVRPFTVARPFVPDDGDVLPRGLALSPDGRTLALGHSDGTVDLLDAQTLRRRRSLRALRGFVGAIAYSPDGRLLAVAGQRGQVTLWDARTLRPAGELSGLADRSSRRSRSRPTAGGSPSPSWAPKWSRGTRRASRAASVRVWDVRSRAPTARALPRRRRPRSPSVPTAASSRSLRSRVPRRSATRAAAGSSRGSAPPTGGDRWRSRPTARCSRPATTTAPASSGRPRAGSRSDGRSRAMTNERFLWMEFTPDGTMLASAGQDGAVALWDVETQNPIGPPLTDRARQLHRRRPVARRLAPVRSLRSPGEPSAGTSLQRPGSGTPAVSRGASSHGRSGPTRCPASPTEPSAGPIEDSSSSRARAGPLRYEERGARRGASSLLRKKVETAGIEPASANPSRPSF